MKILVCFAVLAGLGSVVFATVIPADKENVISLDGTWRFKLEQAKGNYEGKGEKKRRS